jgi:hypothetical protein
MTPARHGAAEESEKTLQEGARRGNPVMIPGSFEARAGRSTASSKDGAARVPPYVPSSAVLRRSILERVWRYVMRPTDTPPF